MISVRFQGCKWAVVALRHRPCVSDLPSIVGHVLVSEGCGVEGSDAGVGATLASLAAEVRWPAGTVGYRELAVHTRNSAVALPVRDHATHHLPDILTTEEHTYRTCRFCHAEK